MLVAEIGSTTTVVNAFSDIKTEKPVFLGQGMAATSIGEGDVTLGLDRARSDLARKLGVSSLEGEEVFASSSAAGGLSMTVHGLVPDMTVRAAREAALGSGAVLKMVTSGRIRPHDLQRVRDLDPRIILVAGGTNGGERETALHNFELLAGALPHRPFLYAGNDDNDPEIRDLAQRLGVRVYITENVYPSLDQLNIVPARRVIQDIFEDHIVEAPGMARIHQAVNGRIMPTPGAVMAMTERIYEVLGDVLTLDIGGATTDVHSVTGGSEALQAFQLDPEPFAKRTVEGDLGVFVNRDHVLSAMTDQERQALGEDYPDRLARVAEVPRDEDEAGLILPLVQTCCREALGRHAGRIQEQFTAKGRRTLVRGRDLTAVKTILATGGALTRLPGVEGLVRQVLEGAEPDRLFPPPEARILIDRDYLAASCGVMAKSYPQAAVHLLQTSLEMKTTGG